MKEKIIYFIIGVYFLAIADIISDILIYEFN